MKILIIVEGGVVQTVRADTSGAKAIVIDHDNNDSTDEELEALEEAHPFVIY